ncbi:UDP-glucose 4-epimerase GalE [Deferribacter autotrophicus]|uniref:UDP-glucose 4-epimerase n=1 Tax=Deferribacter autotrophicus TaxID=500465 RepID=A0A5A8F5K3_9BACT|nr:UDP-glucose 4-epimerase GalE [Deferribacter autotrophicus]KAA0259337.1 UDP-glucose 4-epimerase GalE [Deferribacter autotrophicus]
MAEILVTGGAGYIGSHVVKQLIEETDHRVHIIDNLSTGFIETIKRLEEIAAGKNKQIKFTKLDLSHWDKVDNFIKENNFDAVIHFAAALIVPESVENPLKYYLNNTANTAHLIKCCVENKVNKFIFSSTAAVYGEPDKKSIPIDEDCPTNPINPYGMSKRMSEIVLKDAAKAHSNFNYVILRYFNVAGADPLGRIGQSTKNATHLIKVAAETALGKRKKMYIFGDDYETRDGTCIRDYIHVDDLAKSHLLAYEYLKNGHSSDVFNCGYGYGFTVKEVIDTMKKVSGVDFDVEIVGRRAGDPAELVADNKKIKTILNFKPVYDDLEFICKTALEWEKKLT